MAKQIIEVSISNLELDQENARFENNSVLTQRDAIQYLLSIGNMADKIGQLAEHIARFGDDPSELPLIIPHDTKNNSYVVVEGNRRLLALKLLRNPDLCPSSQKSLQKRLHTIVGGMQHTVPKAIQCSLLENRSAANMWIELKHTGENNGVGRVEWDGSAKDAFREKLGGAKSVGRIMLDYIAGDPEFDEELRNYSKSIGITNLTRLFGSSEAMRRIGYQIRSGNLFLAHSVSDFRKAVEAVIHRFKEDNIKVADIYDAKARKRFFDNHIDKNVLPEIKSSPEYRPLDFSKAAPEAETAPVPDDRPESRTAGAKTKSVPASNLRKKLINFPLSISHERANRIYLELKNIIDVTQTPNAASVLFRVFLELTTDHALQTLKLNTKAGVSKDAILRIKIDAVLNKLGEKNKLDRKEAADIGRLTANESFKSGTVDGLHRFIHGSAHPIAKDLNDIMDNWKPYFIAVWEYDRDFRRGAGQSQSSKV